MKKVVALLASIYLVTHLAACTSSDSKDDSGDGAEVSEEAVDGGAEETAAVDGELENAEGTETAQADEANAGFVDEQLPEQALGEAPPAEAPPEEAPPTEVAAAEPPPEAPPAEMAPEAASEPAAPVAEPVAGVDAGAPPAEPVAMASNDAPAEPKPKASLKKVKDAPFTQGGQLLNAVYIARPGDTYKKIATNIYGDGKRQKDLKKANPSISSPKPGDKVYYNSPARPTDDTAMKTYYEENGMAPEIYVAKDGDNLKTVSSELLGYDGAWKEVWVTNAGVDSKDSLMAGTELRYWKNVPVTSAPPMETAPSMAMNNAPPPPVEQMPPPPTEQMPPPADPMAAGAAVAQNELPPPPPVEQMPPPPPPPMEAAPPPPPPMPEAKPKVAQPEVAEDMSNDDLMMGLAGLGIVAAGIAGIMVVRKRRQQKEMAAAFGDTQIGAS